jgi:hypothetical protein
MSKKFEFSISRLIFGIGFCILGIWFVWILLPCMLQLNSIASDVAKHYFPIGSLLFLSISLFFITLGVGILVKPYYDRWMDEDETPNQKN